MPYFNRNHYWNINEEMPLKERNLLRGFAIIEEHRLFCQLKGEVYIKPNKSYGKNGAASVDKHGNIYLNNSMLLSGEEWAYIIAHCLLHLAFGHFDQSRIPIHDGAWNPELWNIACDIYIARFLADIKFGSPICSDPASEFSIKLNDEYKIYHHLLHTIKLTDNLYGTNGNLSDMIGLEHPLIYKSGESNPYVENFTTALNNAVYSAVHHAGGHNNLRNETLQNKAAGWFMAHYPLLGSLAASFKIISDIDLCHKHEIHIAAVDIPSGEIYVNPSAKLTFEEWKFVLAHEYLHAGLAHHKRCLGRDPYLWNVACDYIINGWLHDMKIGTMPKDGLLYDPALSGFSAEAIYDILVKEMRKFKKHATFRGFGHGDIMNGPTKRFDSFKDNSPINGVSLDEFLKNALKEGLDFHNSNNRGYLPAGLVAEIRALSTPPIPWEVELGRWFDYQFPPLEKQRSYARPSRRQGSTPDIPRPRYIMSEDNLENRTFAVIVDTSGSMSARQIGLALGAISSYALSKDVPYVRVIFCDADAYDAGYMTPEEIAGRVKVTGGGGTMMQPAVNLIEKAKDFPENGPILLITDGYIEDKLYIRHEHAYLLPKGNKLPFTPTGKTFYFKERTI